jgi:hypothetical protein
MHLTIDQAVGYERPHAYLVFDCLPKIASELHVHHKTEDGFIVSRTCRPSVPGGVLKVDIGRRQSLNATVAVAASHTNTRANSTHLVLVAC